MSLTVKLFGLGVTAVLLVAPVRVDKQDTSVRLAVNDCVADGTCCPEFLSICGLNGQNYQNYYYKSSGSCEDPGG